MSIKNLGNLRICPYCPTRVSKCNFVCAGQIQVSNFLQKKNQMNHNKISPCQNTINHQDCNFFALWRHINAFEYYMQHIVRSQLIICTNKQKITVLRKCPQKLCDRCSPCPQHLETLCATLCSYLDPMPNIELVKNLRVVIWQIIMDIAVINCQIQLYISTTHDFKCCKTFIRLDLGSAL